jgi:sirohydrochlorin ferrochelatase
MGTMTLTLLAHGSPDPRHCRDVAALAGRLKVAGIATSAAYLDHHDPSPAQAGRSWQDAGVGGTTVVPLLISPAYHARVDVPLAIGAMRSAAPQLAVAAADPVGLHPLLLGAAAELIAGSGLPVDARTGIILAAAGSRDLRAVGAMESLFRTQGVALADALGARAVRAAYLDGGRPLGRMRTLMRCVDGCTSFVVVPMVVADGVLRDRIVTAANRHDTPVTPGVLADTNSMADLVVLRAGSAPAPTRDPAPSRAHR